MTQPTMTPETKSRITASLSAYVERRGSINKASKTLQGVSSATISKILSGKDADISDALWRTLSAQLATTDQTGWQIAETGAYKTMLFLLEHAQQDSLVLAITGDAGSGKTEAMRRYAYEGRNVYHITCAEYLNRRSFMLRVLQVIGVDSAGSTVSEMVDDIITELSRQERPLIILDEADKLTDQVLYFFISIYNALEWRCGIVLSSTNYLKRRLERGMRLGKRGYEEIWSRLGRKCIALPLISDEDIAAVCQTNGITSSQHIERIVREAEHDLRKVKRAVYAITKAQQETRQNK